MPVVERRIAGGAVDHGLGDYTEAGIAQANRDDPDVMTAGALAFWRQHAINRPTIAYAVSVDHAHNLVSVFNDAGVRAVVILGDTERRARDWAIAGFRDGSVKVLVNVIVATEGFDLPDASCVIIARPTLSLALYLQMVGRGLRPKPDRGDCLILDLAANALTHGLPEKRREWSLAARGAPALGVTAGGLVSHVLVWRGISRRQPPLSGLWARLRERLQSLRPVARSQTLAIRGPLRRWPRAGLRPLPHRRPYPGAPAHRAAVGRTGWPA